MTKRILLFAAVAAVALSACAKPPATQQRVGAVPIPTPQTVAAWCIDEVNGSDSNVGTTAGNCLKTWHQLYDAVWGCWGSPASCPRLRQNTVITFYNAGDSAGADPITVNPSLETGKYLALVGVPYGCTTDTLANITSGGSSSRTGMQLANLVTLDSGTPGMFLQETTTDAGIKTLGWGIGITPSSASIMMWTQPLVRTSYPGILNVPPAEQGTTWANGDSVTYCSLPQVALTQIWPVLEHAGPGMTQGSVYVSNLNVVSEPPVADSGASIAPLNINANVQLFENFVARPVFVSGAPDGPAPQYFVNDYFASNVFVQGGAQQTWIVGGTVVGNVQGANIVLDGDTYLQGSGNVLTAAAGNFSNAALVGLADAAVLNMLGPTGEVATVNAYDAGVVWNNGTAGILNVMGNSRVIYPSGQYSAAQRLGGTILRLNGQQKACLSYPANAATTQVCNIALSAAAVSAQLDDAGIGGCLTGGQGGGAICNGDL